MVNNKIQAYLLYCFTILLAGVIFLYPEKTKASNTIVPEVKVFENSVQTSSFYGFLSAFRGGARVATGDVDGDSVDEIIVGAGPGGGPNVQVFESDGSKLKSFMAYDISFRNGINVASCDLDGDGKNEIITGPGPRSGPNVKVFDGIGNQLKSFMAYSLEFRGGVNVACGDFTGDLKAEIVTGAGPGGGPHVRTFNIYGESLNIEIWPFSFEQRGGVSVASGNVHGDSKDEIIVAVYKMEKPIVEVWDNQENKVSGFYAYDGRFLGGVNINTGDIDADGYDEIITAANAGGGPHVRTFKYNGEPTPAQFFPYPEDFRGGVYVSAGDVTGDGNIDIITGPGFLPDVRFSNFYKYIEIDISDQKLSIFENGVQLGSYQISSGKPGMDTPNGIYKVMSKARTAYSSRYALYMPWWMQFTGMGHGMHGLPYWKLRSGGVIKEGVNHLGIRVSHGCVRLSWEAAEIVYEFGDVGTPIIIHD